MNAETVAYQLGEMRAAHDRTPFEGGCWFFLSHDQMAQLREGILSDEVKAIAREMTLTVQESIAQRQRATTETPKKTRRRA